MKFVSTLALGVALAVTAGSFAAAPAMAQKKNKNAEAQQQQGARKFNISKQARNQIAAAQAALAGSDPAAFAAAMAAAEAVATTPDDRYILAQFRLSNAIKTNNDAEKIAAINGMLQSGAAGQDELPKIYLNLGQLQYNAKNYPAAQQAFVKAAELQPNNPDTLILIAESLANQNKAAEAVPYFDRAIAARQAAGQQVPEDWYKRALKFTYEGKMAPQAAKLSRDLIVAYPTPQNWRDSLLIYRDITKLDKASNIDLMRLMRASNSMASEADYFELADALNDSGLPGEVKAVIDEGVAKGKVKASAPGWSELVSLTNRRIGEDKASLAGQAQKALAAGGTQALTTGDAFFGYGDYAKAAELYRAAMSKGNADKNVVQTRLGMALAMAGKKAEAEAALKAVSGPRADLAQYWLLWLNSRQG